MSARQTAWNRWFVAGRKRIDLQLEKADFMKWCRERDAKSRRKIERRITKEMYGEEVAKAMYPRKAKP